MHFKDHRETTLQIYLDSQMVLHTAFIGILYSKMFISKGILHVLYDKLLFSLACVSSETHNLQHVFCCI